MIFTFSAQPSDGKISDLVADNYAEYGTPYHSVWAAVILQAMFDVTRVTNHKDQYKYRNIHRLKDSAQYWLFEQEGNEVGTLNWICDHLGLDSDYIRRLAREEIEKTDAKTQIRKYHKRKTRNQVPVKKRRRVFHVVGRSTKKWHDFIEQ